MYPSRNCCQQRWRFLPNYSLYSLYKPNKKKTVPTLHTFLNPRWSCVDPLILQNTQGGYVFLFQGFPTARGISANSCSTACKIPCSEKRSWSNWVVFFFRIITLSPRIMDVENHPKWKETNIGGTPFPLPWLWEEGYIVVFVGTPLKGWLEKDIFCQQTDLYTCKVVQEIYVHNHAFKIPFTRD